MDISYAVMYLHFLLVYAHKVLVFFMQTKETLFTSGWCTIPSMPKLDAVM